MKLSLMFSFCFALLLCNAPMVYSHPSDIESPESAGADGSSSTTAGPANGVVPTSISATSDSSDPASTPSPTDPSTASSTTPSASNTTNGTVPPTTPSTNTTTPTPNTTNVTDSTTASTNDTVPTTASTSTPANDTVPTTASTSTPANDTVPTATPTERPVEPTANPMPSPAAKISRFSFSNFIGGVGFCVLVAALGFIGHRVYKRRYNIASGYGNF